MTLDQIRKRLDRIDLQIVKLLASRQSYMPAVGKYKKKHKMPLYQPKREKEILIAKKGLAKKLGVDAGVVESIFKLIFAASRKIQKKEFISK